MKYTTITLATMMLTGTVSSQLCAGEQGLLAEYFGDKKWKVPVQTRVDATVDFDWTSAPPILEIKGTEFSVRWHGRVEPEFSGKYTFYVTGGVGCRLWVHGNLLVNKIDDGGGTRSGQFDLEAGKSREITVEYRGKVGSGVARLEWESDKRPRQIISPERLSSQRPNPPASYLREPLPFWGADPAPVVGREGRLYLYPTDSGPRADPKPTDWYSYSSSDLVHWEEHGRIIGVSDLQVWGTKAYVAIAPGAIYRDGMFFLYYYCHHKEKPNHRGLGVASSPTGKPPFTNHSVKAPLIEGIHDPAVFIEDDGQAYLFEGEEYIKLNQDMVSTSGDLTPFKYAKGTKSVGEAAFIFKRGDIYYMLRGDHRRLSKSIPKDFRDNEESVVYFTAPSFTGPWEYAGVVMNPVSGQSRHASAFFWKDKWMLSYHIWTGAELPTRRPALAELHFNPDGSIQPVQHIEAGRFGATR